MATCASGVRTRGLQIEIASVATSATSASTDTLQTGPAAEFLCYTKIHQTREIFPGSPALLFVSKRKAFGTEFGGTGKRIRPLSYGHSHNPSKRVPGVRTRALTMAISVAVIFALKPDEKAEDSFLTANRSFLRILWTDFTL